jgi:hypothetical protein
MWFKRRKRFRKRPSGPSGYFPYGMLQRYGRRYKSNNYVVEKGRYHKGGFSRYSAPSYSSEIPYENQERKEWRSRGEQAAAKQREYRASGYNDHRDRKYSSGDQVDNFRDARVYPPSKAYGVPSDPRYGPAGRPLGTLRRINDAWSQMDKSTWDSAVNTAGAIYRGGSISDIASAAAPLARSVWNGIAESLFAAGTT